MERHSLLMGQYNKHQENDHLTQSFDTMATKSKASFFMEVEKDIVKFI